MKAPLRAWPRAALLAAGANAVLVAAAGSAAAAEPGAIVLSLGEPPATQYGARSASDEDRREQARIEPLGAAWDPALAHAARELARFESTHGAGLLGDALGFALDAAGAAVWDVERLAVVTDSRDPDAALAPLRKQIAAVPPGAGAARVGFGESAGRDGRRHVIALVVRGAATLDPVPRRVAPGARVPIAGRLPPGARSPELLVLDTAGGLTTVVAPAAGRRFSAEVAVGGAPGVAHVELIVTTDAGPSPLAQLALHVGRPPPVSLRLRPTRDESGIDGEAEGRAYVHALIAADREDAGLPPPRRDPALDAIALAHSREMRDARRVFHRSPRHGSPRDRLAAAGFRAAAYGENVARDGGLADAERALLRSLGHRRNLLAAELTHVGVGAVPAVEDGRRVWYVTQLFARPAPAAGPAVGDR